MMWSSLSAVQVSTKCEFTKALAQRHHFVRLPSGRWTRTLGAPGLMADQKADGLFLVHVRGRVWRMERAS